MCVLCDLNKLLNLFVIVIVSDYICEVNRNNLTKIWNTKT